MICPPSVRICAGFLSTPSARRATVPVGKGYFCAAVFLSTPSARRATCEGFKIFNIDFISIHALREEGDPFPR